MRGSHVMPRLVAKAADTLPEIDLRGRSELWRSALSANRSSNRWGRRGGGGDDLVV